MLSEVSHQGLKNDRTWLRVGFLSIQFLPELGAVVQKE